MHLLKKPKKLVRVCVCVKRGALISCHWSSQGCNSNGHVIRTVCLHRLYTVANMNRYLKRKQRLISTVTDWNTVKIDYKYIIIGSQALHCCLTPEKVNLLKTIGYQIVDWRVWITGQSDRMCSWCLTMYDATLRKDKVPWSTLLNLEES